MFHKFESLYSPVRGDLPDVPSGRTPGRQKLDPNLVDLAQGVARSIDILEERGLVKPEVIELFETKAVQRVCLGLNSAGMLSHINQDQVNSLRDVVHLVNCMQGLNLKCYYVGERQAILYNDEFLKFEALKKNPLKGCFGDDGELLEQALLLSSDGILGLVLYDLAAQDGWFYERFTRDLDLNQDEAAVRGEYSKVRQAKDWSRSDDMRIEHLVVPSAREDLKIWEQSIRSHLDSLKLYGHQNTDFWMFLEREDNASGEELEQRKREVIQRLSDEYKINIHLINMEAKDKALDILAQQHCEAKPGLEQASVKNQWKQSCLEHRVAGAQRNWYRTFLDQQGSLLCFDDDSLAALTTVQSLSRAQAWIKYETSFMRCMQFNIRLPAQSGPEFVSDRGILVSILKQSLPSRKDYVSSLIASLSELKLLVIDDKIKVRCGTLAEYLDSNKNCCLPIDCCGIASRKIGRRVADLKIPFISNGIESDDHLVLGHQEGNGADETYVSSINFQCSRQAAGSYTRMHKRLLYDVLYLRAKSQINAISLGFYAVPLVDHTSFSTTTSHCINLSHDQRKGASDSLLRAGPLNSIGVRTWVSGAKKVNVDAICLDHLGAERPYNQLARESLGTCVVNEMAIDAAYSRIDGIESCQEHIKSLAYGILHVELAIKMLLKRGADENSEELSFFREDLKQMGDMLKCDFRLKLGSSSNAETVMRGIRRMINLAGEFEKLRNRFVREILQAQEQGAEILAARRKVDLLKSPYVEIISSQSI